ncbi:uncharacterized protein LOC126233683 [Schistocerca nitens]|uniref:uncharacterized protein LOC126233683 n=1 Tax=Schistocerca nitens TaxID=7011 RepID=UPI002117429A|nr:uncharacterized protein LOC126233683 [Schistocerca nitens]
MSRCNCRRSRKKKKKKTRATLSSKGEDDTTKEEIVRHLNGLEIAGEIEFDELETKGTSHTARTVANRSAGLITAVACVQDNFFRPSDIVFLTETFLTKDSNKVNIHYAISVVAEQCPKDRPNGGITCLIMKIFSPFSVSHKSRHSLVVTTAICVLMCEIALFTEEEIIHRIMSTKNNKVCDPDNIYSEHLKTTFPVLVIPLTALLNECLKRGSLPDQWKHSKVIILYMGKGNTADPNTYWGTALGNTLFKIFTTLLCKRLEISSMRNSPIHSLTVETITGTMRHFPCMEARC